MATIVTINVPAPRMRNTLALAAKMRRAVAMKHKNTPRGGQRNDYRDYLDEAYARCYVCGKPLAADVAFVCSKRCSDEAEASAAL